MKSSFTILLSVVISIILAGCRQGSTADNTEQVSGISFTGTIYNFGDIEYDSDGGCGFEFMNTSKVPLIINNVRTSCGCINPSWPKTPVAPNEKGVIRIEYNTKITGSFRKSVYIYSNAKNSPVTLQLKGNVLKEKRL